MRKLFFAAFVLLLVAGCKQKEEAAAPKKDDGMQALYEKNLATLKTSLAAFEKEDIEGWASNVADSVKFHSPAYGDTVTTKAHWKEALKFYADNWNNLKLNHPNFLPGLDSSTHQIDGSVRFYGEWSGIHTSGVATVISFYGTYDFNKDGKVTDATEFFDVGGLMNAVQPKAK